MRAPIVCSLATLTVASFASTASALDLFGWPPKCPNADGGPFEKVFDPRVYPGYDHCQHDFQRAGNPQCTSRLAQPTHRVYYNGYYVGGGAPFYGWCPDKIRGVPRYQTEGTFGVDYDPPWSRVRLQWFHGTRYQEGEGKYETDRRNNPFARFFSGRNPE